MSATHNKMGCKIFDDQPCQFYMGATRSQQYSGTLFRAHYRDKEECPLNRGDDNSNCLSILPASTREKGPFNGGVPIINVLLIAFKEHNPNFVLVGLCLVCRKISDFFGV